MSRRELSHRLIAGVVCGLGVLSALAPTVGRGAAPTPPTPGLSGRAGLEALRPLRGVSGKLEAAFRTPGEPLFLEPLSGLTVHYEPDQGTVPERPGIETPQRPGVYRIAVGVNSRPRDVEHLRLITLVPFSAKKAGQIGSYRLGQWPYERGGAPSRAYANPTGFVEVTRENRGIPVSEHFTLGDFLTKDQPAVWPKYLLLDPGLVDKLELILEELENEGHQVRHLAIMSGFRTPRYNQSGGETSGRATLSRHVYGDATDVFVDNDRNGWTDDINRDGRVDIHDAEVVARAAERAEARFPALVGGVGVYPATGGHGPFTHVDARGRRARWRGTGIG
jgi:uncharacterized protein YcbK (DUF882 family)